MARAPAPKPTAPPARPTGDTNAQSGGTSQGDTTTTPSAAPPEIDKAKPTQPADAKAVPAVDLNAPGALDAVRNGAAIVGVDNPYGGDEAKQYNTGFVEGTQYSGPQNDDEAFKDKPDATEAYKQGFRDGKVRKDNRILAGDLKARRDRGPRDPSFDRDGNGHPGGSLKRADRLAYDDGYRQGWATAKTGVRQVPDGDERFKDKQFERGYQTGMSHASDHDAPDKHIMEAADIAREREQEEANELSTEDRLARIERHLGLPTPKKE